jgi:hypothetical protein
MAVAAQTMRCPMRTFAIALTSLALGASPACVHEPTPAERAASSVRAQCGDPKASQDETRVLREMTVIKTEPITFPSGASTRSNSNTMSGTRLLVRPPDGVSAWELALILRCHRAKGLLGESGFAALPADPFYVPDTWVAINVKVETGFLVVELSADPGWQNVDLLHRAIAFADTHRAPSP